MKKSTIGITLLLLVSVALLFLTYSALGELNTSALEQAIRYARVKNPEDRDVYQRYFELYKIQAAIGRSIEPKLHAVVSQCFSDCAQKHEGVELLCHALARDLVHRASDVNK